MNSATRVDVPDSEYHQMPGISQSMIKAFVDDPAQYRQRYVLGEQPDSGQARHFEWGKDFETLLFSDTLPGVLIPNEVLNRSEREGKEVFSKRGTAWSEWLERTKAEHGDDVRVYKQDEWDAKVRPYLIARDNVRAHEKAMKLLTGERHQVLVWDDELTGMPCKCQIDTVSIWKVLTDLKTTRDVRPFEFNRSIFKFGYHIQAEWYRRAWQRYTGELLPFVLVCVQTSPSYSCETYDLDPEWYALAQRQIDDGLKRLKAAYDKDSWHTPTFGKITTLEPERWMLR